jgi:outer membrane protein TolC
VLPEQRQLEIRDPAQLMRVPFPDLPSPRTVTAPEADVEPQRLSLDEAIRTALETTTVVRVLAGVTAVSSGRTIYDPAISNTLIDDARARFDPQFRLDNNFFRNDDPSVILVPPGNAPPQVTGVPQHAYDMRMGLAKNTSTGGTASLDVGTTAIRDRFNVPGQALNPRAPSFTGMSYTQPLLQGAGVQVNVAPIVIARIDTERSFFQLKDSVQRMVRGVVEGYWSLVQARVEAWARRQQVGQGQEAFERALASLEAGMGNAAEVAQARSALANFRASLITAEANVLQREAALRNILGHRPSDA